MSKPKTLREIPFEQIERRFELAPLNLGGKTFPAVAERAEGGYSIRILKNAMTRGANTTSNYDYFYLDADGTVTEAPRGYARDYRPARITGLAEAVERYAGGAR